MPERDAWWSIYLFEQYDKNTIVDRIVAWAWQVQHPFVFDEKSLYLIGKTLCWFFTSSHRYLRDRTTKAFVNLFTNRLDLLPKLIDEFKNIDDLYVVERLLCACYGCVLRNHNIVQIHSLAEKIYLWQFADEHPIPHILIRDYSRGIIDHALRLNPSMLIDRAKIDPPYKSDWPKRIPTKEMLYKKYYIENAKGNEHSQNSIIYSVIGQGDFDRYIIGTNSHSSLWSNKPLNNVLGRKRDTLYSEFIQSLKPIERKAWNIFEDCINRLNYCKTIKKDFYLTGKQKNSEENNYMSQYLNIRKLVLNVIDKEKRSYCTKFAIPYLRSKILNTRIRPFDLSIAQRYILNRVFKMGWNVDKFGHFDRIIPGEYTHSRGTSKPERIGKKYQWLAYYEFMALLSDNFEYRMDNWSPAAKYEGPWQKYLRNIDPSYIIKNNSSKKTKDRSKINPWWAPIKFNSWTVPEDDINWLSYTKDLPDFCQLIEVVNPTNESKWLVLENYISLEQPVPVDVDKFTVYRREMFFFIRSYFIYKKDRNKNWAWVNEQNWDNRWMPESREQTQIFLGEFHNSKAYDFYNIPYYNHDGWSKPDKPNACKMLVSSEQYMQEKGYDCSIDETVLFFLPNELIVKGMGLSWNGIAGQYFNKTGELIAFDPSISTNGPSALVIKKDAFLDFIKTSNYDIFWTISGEKQILAPLFSQNDYKGKLLINGSYQISKNKIVGNLRPVFEPPLY